MAMTANERQKRHTAKKNDLAEKYEEARSKINWQRRARCKASLMEFITTYCLGEGGFFKWAPFPETSKIIDVMQAAASSATPYHIRMTRGGGKTSLMLALICWCIAYGIRKYVVISAATKPQASVMLEDIYNFFDANEEAMEDFPEICVPIRALEGSPQRALSQNIRGEKTKIKKSDKFIYFPTVKDSVSSGSILVAVGFDGRVRGLRKGKLRPDLVLFDDLQDDEMAASPTRVASAREKIQKSYFGLGGHDHKPAMLMTSTPICPDDLSESYANDAGWKTETFPLLWSMPTNRDLWKEYKNIKQKTIFDGKFGEHPETEFYLENKSAMDDGAKPLWQDCFSKDDGEASAVQHAMNLYLNDANSFMSEYQMRPKRESVAIDVSAKEAMSKVWLNHYAREVPPGFVFVAAATDINPSYALTTAVVAFKTDLTAHVIEHVIQPINIDGKANDLAFNQAVYNALAAHGRAIHNLGIKINAWGIDASGHQYEAVTAFAKNSMQICGLSSCGMMGRADIRYNPSVKSRLRDDINGTILCGDPNEHARAGAGHRWIAWNADKYKEAVQRSLLSEVGAQGGLTLFDGIDHTEFCVQITNERLKSKVSLGNGHTLYTWQTFEPHDYLDCVAMCYAIAASQGLNALSTIAPVRRVVARPRVILR